MAPPISGECEGNNPLSDIKEETEEDLEVDAFDYEICRSWRIANWYAARVWMGPTWILTIIHAKYPVPYNEGGQAYGPRIEDDDGEEDVWPDWKSLLAEKRT